MCIESSSKKKEKSKMAANLSGSFGSCEIFRDFLFSSHENLTLFACGMRWRGTSDDNDEEIKMRN